MPTWKSIAPRAGVVYDLFGNQKTAVKASFGKYMQAGTTGFANSQNAMALLTQSVNWTDLNGDGTRRVNSAACTCRLAAKSTSAAMPAPASGHLRPGASTIDSPDIKRMYNVEETVSVQHELMRGVSVTGGWYHRQVLQPAPSHQHRCWPDDFTPFTLYSPIDGSPITYYNVSAAKVAQLTSNLVDQNAPDRTMKYNGFEYNFSARLPKGITLFGGGMSERMLTNTCDDGWNPNLLLYCDQSQNDLPLRTQFKMAGSIPAKYGIQVGLAFQSLPGYVNGTTSQYALTGVSGPSGITTNNPPAGRGSVWLITRTTTLHARATPASRRASARSASWSIRA